ncbi:MAG TPA: exodeoxyribonuclease III, partial [Oceanicaulis sp.]|nr:exodeoxyribonuclease III [Oceanicaulis sp.]
MTLSVATWNVNSIKARLPNVLDWLKEAKPDVACLQEIKTVDEGFPRLEIEELGYNVETVGQKTYNGVALLSKRPIEEISQRALPGDEEDEQARYIEAVISADTGPVRVASIYLPNGNPAPGPKYDYKLKWM